MTFKQWILNFTSEDSPTGDLAVDIERDPLFPSSHYYGEIYDYLESKNSSRLCLQSFEQAWQTYKQEEYK